MNRRLTLIIAIFWATPALADGAIGWRYNGSATFGGVKPAVTWALPGHALWTTPMPAWGNASPVVVGERVFVTAEPTTLLALDAKTGKILWQRTNHFIDTLPEKERSAKAAELNEVEQLESALKDKQRALNKLKREARRRRTDPENAKKMTGLSTELDTMKTRIDATAHLRTPQDKDIIGYASPTPVTDGSSVFALFGNGVFSRFGLDGKRHWSKWLGPLPSNMNGYHTGHSSSPVLAGGVLVVGANQLMGLNPSDGSVVWKGEMFRDYGTPGVATVGDVPVVLTPSGSIVRATDGKVLQRDLGDIWYIGPHISGDRAFYIGGHSEDAIKRKGHVLARAYRLHSPAPGEVRAEKLWEVEVPAKEAFYTTPVLHDGLLYSVTRMGMLRVLDAKTGAIKDTHRLGGVVFASPTVAGDHLFIGADTGAMWVIRPGPSIEITAQNQVGEHRATPFFRGAKMWVRTLKEVLCISR